MRNYEWLKAVLYEWSNHRRRVNLYDLIAAELDKRYPDHKPEVVDGFPVWTTKITVREMYGASAQLPAVGSIVKDSEGKRFRVTSEFRPPKENNAHWATGLCASIASRDYHHTSPRIILEPVKTRKVKFPRVVKRTPGQYLQAGDFYERWSNTSGYYGKNWEYVLLQVDGECGIPKENHCRVEVTFDEVEVPDE